MKFGLHSYDIFSRITTSCLRTHLIHLQNVCWNQFYHSTTASVLGKCMQKQTVATSLYNSENILEIFYAQEDKKSIRCQFHQHFTSSFFIRKSFEQLFCTYIVGFYFFWRKEIDGEIDQRNVYVERKRKLKRVNLFFSLQRIKC